MNEYEEKMVKGLLPSIVLNLMKAEPVHGYLIITRIRKTFGVYCGPSTIYPLLIKMEKEGYIKSHWNMANERPQKVYELTATGQNLQKVTEATLNLVYQKIEVRA